MERPGEATNALFWRAPRAALPLTPLVVGPTDCVVVSLDAAILGVVAPGTHSLDAQTFPFLGGAPAVDLCFVRTSPFRGVSFGGPLGAVHDKATGLTLSPRLMGECTLVVVDPVALVQGTREMASSETLLPFVSAVVLRQSKEVFPRLAEVHGSIMNMKILPQLTQELPAALGELRALGLSVQLGSCNFSLPEEEKNAHKAATAEIARAQRAVKIAEIEKAGAPGGAAGAAAPVAPAASPSAAAKSGSGKGLVLGLVVLLVVGGGVAAAFHFVHGGSHESAPAAAPAKRGKH